MNIRVVVNLDVDPEMWAQTYGVEPQHVEDDVQMWAIVTLEGMLDQVGCGVEW